jgi:hypothetical protein
MSNFVHSRLHSRILVSLGTCLIVVAIALPVLLDRTSLRERIYIGVLGTVGILCIVTGMRLVRRLR